MPRHKRLEIPGAVYHVIARGIERRKIFLDDSDRKEFIRRFSEALKDCGCRCYGWVLMPNHFHLVVRTGAKPLSDLMRRVLTGYAIYFNRRYRRSGYLYQNRYKSILCQEETYLLELVRYAHLNPLRAGMIKDVKSLNKYKWSGHSVIMGRNPAKWQSIGEILGRFGNKRSVAMQKYLDFVVDGAGMGKRYDLTGGGLRRSAGGWSGVYELKRAKESWRGDERILGDGNFVNETLKISEEEMTKKEKLKKAGWDMDKLTTHVCELIGIKRDEIGKKGKQNKISRAKGLIAYWGKHGLGISGRVIGNYLGSTRQAVAYMAKQGEKLVGENKYILSF